MVSNYVKKSKTVGKYHNKYLKAKTARASRQATSTSTTKRTPTPDAFPGKIKGSKSELPDGTKGIFTKTVKGRKGLEFIQKGVENAVEAFLSK